MKNDYNSSLYERNIKNLKDTINKLRIENKKLKINNKEILYLKEIIKKLKKEKLDMSQKIIDYESESSFYKLRKGNKEDMLLYNPRYSKTKFKINLEKSFFSFSIFGVKNKGNLSINQDKCEEIAILKNELIKKEEIISLMKSNKKGYKPVIINNFSINSSSSTSQINSKANSAKKYMTFKNDNIKNSYNNNSVFANYMKPKVLNKITSTFSWKEESHLKSKTKKSKNNTQYEDGDSHGSLEKNIFKEIQNILEEKRNFIIKTLTTENFSFDLLSSKEDKKNNNSEDNFITGFQGLDDIDQLIEIIKKRKIKVQKIKKYFEDKLT